jgi:hypothetical protein
MRDTFLRIISSFYARMIMQQDFALELSIG